MVVLGTDMWWLAEFLEKRGGITGSLRSRLAKFIKNRRSNAKYGHKTRIGTVARLA